MGKPVFLDWASTSPVVKYPQQLYRDVLGEGYFLNPNANYAYREKRLLEQAENRVKNAIGAKSGKVVFGGTSSQLIENLMNANHDYQVWCSPWEHDSSFRYTDDNNVVSDLDTLESWLKIAIPSENDDYYVSRPIVMWQGINNITGEIFPVTEIGKLCHKYDAFYVCDATAMIGHANIPANIDSWCSAFIIDGHKLGTELGIGAMWISDRLDEWLNGFKLHGTPNLAGALAMTRAVEDVCDSKTIERNNSHWVKLANKFGGLLNRNNIEHTFVPFVLDDYTSAINAIRLLGFNADALQQYLASKQIYVSIGGSACAEKHDFRVLNAYGLSNDEASEVIRISFDEDSSVEDVKALVDGIKEFKEKFV